MASGNCCCFLCSQIKLHFSGLSTDTTNIDILQAQVRDARKVVSKLEEVRLHSLISTLKQKFQELGRVIVQNLKESKMN